MKKGFFFVFEGLDGSGKGEMIRRLEEYLSAKLDKYCILTTAEPSSSQSGKRIRGILGGDHNPQSKGKELLELYIKDRKEHVEKDIIPFLKKDGGNKVPVVLCDRYYYSTIAYQGLQGIPLNELLAKNKDFPKPDIAFILDVPAEVALKRITISRGNTEKFEEIRFLTNLRKAFLSLQEVIPDNIKIVDANREPEKVFEDIKNNVIALINDVR